MSGDFGKMAGDGQGFMERPKWLSDGAQSMFGKPWKNSTAGEPPPMPGMPGAGEGMGMGGGMPREPASMSMPTMSGGGMPRVPRLADGAGTGMPAAGARTEADWNRIASMTKWSDPGGMEAARERYFAGAGGLNSVSPEYLSQISNPGRPAGGVKMPSVSPRFDGVGDGPAIPRLSDPGFGAAPPPVPRVWNGQPLGAPVQPVKTMPRTPTGPNPNVTPIGSPRPAHVPANYVQVRGGAWADPVVAQSI